MKTRTATIIALLAALLSIALLVTSCSSTDETPAEVSKYTDQVARAIIEGSWKIAGSIVFAAFIRGALNK